MSCIMSGSTSWNAGVIEVIHARRRPAMACISLLSFISRSSKISGKMGMR